LLGCPGVSVQFTDMSTNNPTSWNWTFANGIPSSSSLQNPIVTYTAAGTYNDVKLVSSNPSGSDSATKYSYIGISPVVKPVTNPAGTVMKCGSSLVLNASYGASYSWLPNGSTSGSMNALSSGIYSVIVTDMFGCQDTSAPVNLTLDNLMAPVISANGNTLMCSAAYSYQWFDGTSTAIAGATSQTYAGTGGSAYYVVITDSLGCSKSSSVVYASVFENTLAGVNFEISPSPNNGTFMLDISLADQRNLSAEVLDITGRLVYSRELGTLAGRMKQNFSLDLNKGMYFMKLKGKEGSISKKFLVE